MSADSLATGKVISLSSVNGFPARIFPTVSALHQREFGNASINTPTSWAVTGRGRVDLVALLGVDERHHVRVNRTAEQATHGLHR